MICFVNVESVVHLDPEGNAACWHFEGQVAPEMFVKRVNQRIGSGPVFAPDATNVPLDLALLEQFCNGIFQNLVPLHVEM